MKINSNEVVGYLTTAGPTIPRNKLASDYCHFPMHRSNMVGLYHLYMAPIRDGKGHGLGYGCKPVKGVQTKTPLTSLINGV